MKKLMLVLTLVGCLFASSVLAHDLNGKIGVGGKWTYLSGVGGKVKLFTSSNQAFEVGGGLTLGTAVWYVDGGQVIHFLASEALTPYAGYGVTLYPISFTILTVTVAGLILDPHGKGGVEYFVNDNLSVFGEGTVGYGMYVGTGGFLPIGLTWSVGGGVNYYLK